MPHRFTEAAGRAKLIEALREQRLVQGKASVAKYWASRGKVVEVPTGSTLIQQGDTDDAVYLILAGEVEVFINHRPKDKRGARETVGEMAAIDPAARRSATKSSRSSSS